MRKREMPILQFIIHHQTQGSERPELIPWALFFSASFHTVFSLTFFELKRFEKREARLYWCDRVARSILG